MDGTLVIIFQRDSQSSRVWNMIQKCSKYHCNYKSFGSGASWIHLQIIISK